MENTVINPWWFYLADVVNSVSCLLIVVGSMAAIIGSFNWTDKNTDKREASKAFRLLVAGLLLLTLNIFVPSKQTVVQMFVASRVTQGQVEDPNIKEVYSYIERTADKLTTARR